MAIRGPREGRLNQNVCYQCGIQWASVKRRHYCEECKHKALADVSITKPLRITRVGRTLKAYRYLKFYEYEFFLKVDNSKTLWKSLRESQILAMIASSKNEILRSWKVQSQQTSSKGH